MSSGRIAPERRWKRSLAAPTGRCTYPLGCSRPALPDRWSCAEHAADLERRAAGLIEAHERKTNE